MRLIAELPWVEPSGPWAGDGGPWRRLATHPAAFIALLLTAFWPVWAWYARRIVDGSDEPLGLGALAVAGGLLWHQGRAAGWARPEARRQWMALALVAIYAAVFPFAPALVRAVLAMIALALVLPPIRGAAGVGGLLLLSLPLVATMQFYLGYPLRVIAAEATRLVLTGSGYAVAREGTALLWAGESVLVDAPCSGVQMLWAGGVLACILAAVRGLSLARTMVAGLAAVGLIVAANALRAAGLFFKEAGIVALPEWTHAGIGLAAFAAAASGIGCVVRRLGVVAAAADLPLPLHHPLPLLQPKGRKIKRKRKRKNFPWSLAIVCLVAALVPALVARHSPSPRAMTGAERWPESLAALTEIPLSARELRFSADFPGRIARFTDGRREYIARLVSQPTRKLHSSADCFRGLGYTVAPQPALLDAQGKSWARFTATRGTCRLLVRERIEGQDGTAWTDVSAWFWQVSLRSAQGPWLATTVVENEF